MDYEDLYNSCNITTGDIKQNIKQDREYYKSLFSSVQYVYPQKYQELDPHLNRYSNVYPFENNRITVKGKYTNASPMTDYKNEKKFIACQSPLAEEIELFWEMVVQENVHIIFNLTEFDNSEKYWPDSLSKQSTLELNNGMKIRLSFEDEEYYCDRNIVKRKLYIDSKVVYHVHYVGWTDNNMPKNPKHLIKLLQFADQYNKNDTKMLVHCSAGINRTVCFIILKNIIDYIVCNHARDKEIDSLLKDELKRQRENRPMVASNPFQTAFVLIFIQNVTKLINNTD